jgi:hypothetical protein
VRPWPWTFQERALLNRRCTATKTFDRLPWVVVAGMLVSALGMLCCSYNKGHNLHKFEPAQKDTLFPTQFQHCPQGCKSWGLVARPTGYTVYQQGPCTADPKHTTCYYYKQFTITEK